MRRVIPTPEQVRIARAGLGWSQRRLAARAQLHPNTVIKYEQDGISQPTGWQISKVLRRAGIRFGDPAEAAVSLASHRAGN